MNTSDLKSFNYLENGDITFSNLDTIKTQSKLEPGEYIISFSGYPKNIILLKQSTNNEIVKSHTYTDRILLENSIKAFTDPIVVSQIKKLGYNHKLGVLLYGREGTGKSTIIKYFSDRLIKECGAVTFIVEDSGEYLAQIFDFIKEVRKIQSDIIITIIDEIESFFKYPHNESILKKQLDGFNSIDNSIFFASTNYIDIVPDAIKKRPSRFKYVLEITDITKDEDISLIMKEMIGDLFTDKQIDQFITQMDNKSLDSIKQFCLDKIMNIDNYNNKVSKREKLGFKIN